MVYEILVARRRSLDLDGGGGVLTRGKMTTLVLVCGIVACFCAIYLYLNT